MNPDDPFGEIGDPDQTVRLPRPGGSRAAPAPEPAPAAPPPKAASEPAAAAPAAAPTLRPLSPDLAADGAFSVAALNPLVAVAAPLLWLASRLNDSLGPEDVDELQDRVIAELRRFEGNALAKGVPPESVRLGRYALCATLDDVVMNTSWGGHSAWPSKTLVSTLYNEAIGGERFFDILDQLMADPNANADLLELMAICISIGFVGKYRVQAGGMPQLARLRDDLHRALRRVRGSYERDLSTNWRGLACAHKPPPSPRAMWIVAGVAVAVLLSLYVVFSMTLRAQSEVVINRLNALVPAETLPVPEAPKPPPPPPKVVLTQLQRIQQALAAEIADGSLQVVEQPKTIAIRILGKMLFASGKDRIEDSFRPTLGVIAKVLNNEPGPIQVVGHADSIPMRGLSNAELSRLRAEAVAKMLAEHMTAPERLSAIGKGDSEPIASNQTAAGRDRNRRVEVVIARDDVKP